MTTVSFLMFNIHADATALMRDETQCYNAIFNKSTSPQVHNAFEFNK